MQTLNVYKYIMGLVRERGHDASFDAENPADLNKSFHDENSNAHVICTRDGCLSILKDESFVQPKIADAVAEIGERLELNVKAIEDFLRYNPIQIDGEAHGARRKLFLNEYNGKCRDSVVEFREIAEAHFALFSKKNVSCTATALIEPYVDSALQKILGTYDKNAAALYGSVRGQGYVLFEYIHPPARLSEKSRQAEHFLAGLDLANEMPDASRERGLFMLTYILQGRDPLVGGLGAYLHGLLELDEAGRLARIDTTTARELFWRSSPVNYIGRVATKTKIIDGITINPGDRILLMLPWANHGKGCTAKDSIAFGSGAHVCAGQALALTIAEAWLWGLKKYHRHIDWPGIKPGCTVPAVFRQYRN